MKEFKYVWIVGLLVTALIIAVPIVLLVNRQQQPSTDPWDAMPEHPAHTSHVGLFTEPLETGSDVTRACISCHEEAATEVMQTVHFQWRGEPTEIPGHEDTVLAIGKANLLNNFCIGIQSNWTGCTRCHAGYGWDSADYDFSNPENIDCLVCHAQDGTYAKAKSGLPAEGVDLLAAAESVGIPTRDNCGYCHFNGGGGDAVKHGDLDETLYYPTDHEDVHMGRHDFMCTDCHVTENHQIRGRAISVSVDATTNQVHCSDCHTEQPHTDDRLNAHTETVACQTCHVPAGAVREPTKMIWDWSTAGDDNREENPHEYLKIKGSFVYEANFMPEYAWFNGTVAYRYLLGDPIPDPSQPTPLNPPAGDINDPNAQIWPFKIHRATQIYDPLYGYLIQPQTVGEDGYWTHFDWNLAAENGMATVGLPYSGQYDFVPTTMYWPLSHMVQPAEHALQCVDCHSENGRLDWEALGYPGDPMRWGSRTSEELAAYLNQIAN
ncbi:MAG: tetrathionate reductase family octaheme c-type cytochrome [Anaerolineae bacterium]